MEKICRNCVYCVKKDNKDVCTAHFYVKSGTRCSWEVVVMPHFKCSNNKFKFKD